MHFKQSSITLLAAGLLAASGGATLAGDINKPASPIQLAQADGPMVITPQPNRQQGTNPGYSPPSGEAASMPFDPGGPGKSYEPAPSEGVGPYVTARQTQDSSFS